MNGTRKYFGSFFPVPLFHVRPSSPRFSSLRRMRRLRRYALSDWQRRQGPLSLIHCFSFTVGFPSNHSVVGPPGMVVAVRQYPVGVGKARRMLRGQLGKCSELIVLINVHVLLHSSLTSHSVLSLLMAFLKKSKDSQSHVSFPSILSTTSKFRPFSNQLS